jgi:glycosyltransferase involved in cell wall biosynthesis
VRILIVSHPPLTAELGASQVAMSLAAALAARGHDARAWSPEPLPEDTRWFNLRRRQRRAIELYAAAHGPFDVIDSPALTASRRLARHGALVVRSVQPELRYLWRGLRADLARPLPLRGGVHAVFAVPTAAAIVGGWRRARAILCLGSLELDWMRRRFPGWRDKLGLYLNTLPTTEQDALAAVRRGRAGARGVGAAGGAATSAGRRYLWLGRWTAHKGLRPLLRFLAERLDGPGGDSFTLAGCGRAPELELPAAWLRSGRVALVPSFTRSDLPALLASHDAGLFTSDVEGWGLNLNEMLESGMPVFATEAGGVADLRPFFPRSLRPFPPPPPKSAGLAAGPLEDLDANGYRARFSWAAIAASWERQVLALAGGARR